MSNLEKQMQRLLSKPKDYTFSEASSLLCALGFELQNKGKTSGSRVKFYRKSDGRLINLHRPHPEKEMRYAATLALLNTLKENGDIHE